MTAENIQSTKISRNEKRLLIVLATNILIFMTITLLVINAKTDAFDTPISSFIYTLRTPTTVTTMFFVTRVAGVSGVIIIASIVSVFLALRYRRAAVFFIVVFFVSVSVNILFKLLLKIPRPTLSPLQNLTDFSYPSGHAMNNASLYSLILYILYRMGKKRVVKILIIPATIWVMLIGFSRVFLGSHYISDIIGGITAGVAIVASFILLLNTYRSLSD